MTHQCLCLWRKTRWRYFLFVSQTGSNRLGRAFKKGRDKPPRVIISE